MADKNKFSQVIRNLTSNALKFSPPGSSVTIKVYLMNRHHNEDTVGFPLTCQRLRIDVIDSGVGISEVSDLMVWTDSIRYGYILTPVNTYYLMHL